MKRYRRNAITSDDMMHLAFAGVTGIAIGFIMARKSQVATAGLGAYFHNKRFIPINGLGLDYHDPRSHRFESYMAYPRGYR